LQKGLRLFTFNGFEIMKNSSSFQSLASRTLTVLALSLSSAVWAHGDVTPQAVDTSSLPTLGSEWKIDNPFRGNAAAVKVGASAFGQNCARCHGLDAVSGGIAPDLRKLDNECVAQRDVKKQTACLQATDEYFVGRVRRGFTRNGAVYMPPFEGILNQEAVWSIKSYLESRREKPLLAAK
jgi:cytochrome c-550 PedF